MNERTRRERMLLAQKIEIRPGSEARRRNANIPERGDIFDNSKHTESSEKRDRVEGTPKVKHRGQVKLQF